MSSPKVVFITGANSGIGYETVKALLQSTTTAADTYYHIFLGCRDPSKANDAIAKLLAEEAPPGTKCVLEAVTVDVCDDESINAAFETMKGKVSRVDTLINNAGTKKN
jgi:NAD(P)-dependent dehydrogenase (short-subunit alcohol dehydrogenase family)